MSCRCRFSFCGRTKLRGLCCWLVVCSAPDVGNSVVDEVNSDVLCLSVVIDGEVGDVAVVDNVVSSVEPLSIVDDSNLDDVIEDIAVVYVV